MKKYNKQSQRTGKKHENRKFSKNNRRKRTEHRGGTRGRAVALRPGESVDQLIKRFKRVVEASGVMREVKKREYYMSRSEKIRDKKKRALKRLRKRMRAAQRYNRNRD